MNNDDLLLVPKVPAAFPPKKEKETSVISKEEIIEKYKEWVSDTTTVDKTSKLGIGWMGPGLLIEIFAPDFSYKSKVIGTDNMYLRISPYARILSCSPHNEGPRADLKPGDIVYIGDVASNIKKNPNWEIWAKAGNASGKLTNKEPLEYIRSVHTWVQNGKLFFLDKAEYMSTNDLVEMDEQRMKIFKGPWIFEVGLETVKMVIKNPWGLE